MLEALQQQMSDLNMTMVHLSARFDAMWFMMFHVNPAIGEDGVNGAGGANGVSSQAGVPMLSPMKAGRASGPMVPMVLLVNLLRPMLAVCRAATVLPRARTPLFSRPHSESSQTQGVAAH